MKSEIHKSKLLIIFFIAALWGCNKEVMPSDGKKVPKIIWKVPLGPKKYDQLPMILLFIKIN
jgi:hypothetical protein